MPAAATSSTRRSTCCSSRPWPTGWSRCCSSSTRARSGSPTGCSTRSARRSPPPASAWSARCVPTAPGGSCPAVPGVPYDVEAHPFRVRSVLDGHVVSALARGARRPARSHRRASTAVRGGPGPGAGLRRDRGGRQRLAGAGAGALRGRRPRRVCCRGCATRRAGRRVGLDDPRRGARPRRPVDRRRPALARRPGRRAGGGAGPGRLARRQRRPGVVRGRPVPRQRPGQLARRAGRRDAQPGGPAVLVGAGAALRAYPEPDEPG